MASIVFFDHYAFECFKMGAGEDVQAMDWKHSARTEFQAVPISSERYATTLITVLLIYDNFKPFSLDEDLRRIRSTMHGPQS